MVSLAVYLRRMPYAWRLFWEGGPFTRQLGATRITRKCKFSDALVWRRIMSSILTYDFLYYYFQVMCVKQVGNES